MKNKKVEYVITLLLSIIFMPFVLMEVLVITVVIYAKNLRMRGTGFVVCDYCMGSGEIDDLYGPYPCNRCHGSGKLDWIQRVIYGE